jgi:hypothetical protein
LSRDSRGVWFSKNGYSAHRAFIAAETEAATMLQNKYESEAFVAGLMDPRVDPDRISQSDFRGHAVPVHAAGEPSMSSSVMSFVSGISQSIGNNIPFRAPAAEYPTNATPSFPMLDIPMLDDSLPGNRPDSPSQSDVAMPDAMPDTPMPKPPSTKRLDHRSKQARLMLDTVESRISQLRTRMSNSLASPSVHSWRKEIRRLHKSIQGVSKRNAVVQETKERLIRELVDLNTRCTIFASHVDSAAQVPLVYNTGMSSAFVSMITYLISM